MNAIECPRCKHVNSTIDNELIEIGGHAPIRCAKCNEIYIVWHNIDAEVADGGNHIPLQLPPLSVGTQVLMITNIKHPLAGNNCEIVDKNHRRYRVKFDDGTLLWIPDHWVKRDHLRNRHRNNGN